MNKVIQQLFILELKKNHKKTGKFLQLISRHLQWRGDKSTPASVCDANNP